MIETGFRKPALKFLASQWQRTVGGVALGAYALYQTLKRVLFCFCALNKRNSTVMVLVLLRFCLTWGEFGCLCLVGVNQWLWMLRERSSLGVDGRCSSSLLLFFCLFLSEDLLLNFGLVVTSLRAAVSFRKTISPVRLLNLHHPFHTPCAISSIHFRNTTSLEGTTLSLLFGRICFVFSVTFKDPLPSRRSLAILSSSNWFVCRKSLKDWYPNLRSLFGHVAFYDGGQMVKRRLTSSSVFGGN